MIVDRPVTRLLEEIVEEAGLELQECVQQWINGLFMSQRAEKFPFRKSWSSLAKN